LALSTLLACLRIDGANADLLAVVSDTARRFGSSVIGVVAKQASAHVQSRGAGPLEPREYDLRMFRERASAAEAEFRDALSNIRDLEWRTQLTFGPVAEQVANEARSADLVVAQSDHHDGLFLPSGQPDVGDLLMRLGRPVLAVPPDASGLELNRALVCWKDSREARRAVADSLPMLQASQRVDIVEIVEAQAVDEARRRLRAVCDWLQRNGVASKFSAEISNGAEAPQLAAIARELDADLIVAGAFGHSRLREWAFGGVTRDLLLHTERCVLASH
jgi:nucleotide-binding universal stress UspA family protein